MTLPSSFKTLTKTDRRKQWKLLKTKHSKAIAKAKLDFDLKLGPALDKYQTQVDKLIKLSAKAELQTEQVQPVLEAYWALRKSVSSYRDKVKTLEEAAKKELTALLKAIETDGENWEKLALALQGRRAAGATPEQQKAAAGLVIMLDNIRGLAQVIVTRGERAVDAYKNNKPNPRPEAAALASKLVEAARLAGPTAYELANAASVVAKGTNYALFKSRAKAAERQVKGFRKAAHEFFDAWDLNKDIFTTSADIDAMALKGNYEQIVKLCDGVLDGIAKLP